MRNRNALALAAVLFAVAAAVPAGAAVKTETVAYEHGETALQGFLAWDDAVSGKRPGVMVVHEWWGLNDYARERAKQLAGLGYVAFAADMYGAGRVTDKPEEAGHWSSMLGQNMEEALGRARAGLEVLRTHAKVDADRVAVIGYCFGGTTATVMAYAGLPLRGAVSFHGSLPLPPETTPKVTVPLLIAHGAADTFVPADHLQKFTAALTAKATDWQMVSYGGAVHSFTVKGAEARGIPGLAYDEAADRRSWALMLDFFAEVFGK